MQLMFRHFVLALLLTCAICAAPSVAADVWDSWRQNAKADTTDADYVAEPGELLTIKPWVSSKDSSAIDGVTPMTSDVEGEPAIFARYQPGNKAASCVFALPEVKLSPSEGVEMTWRVRLGATPSGAMSESASLAQFNLRGAQGNATATLHAYSKKPGLMLNQILHARKPAWKEVVLKRGLVEPANAVAFDTRWHTVRMAWCAGRMTVVWDGLVVLRVNDPSIDFRSVSLDWVKPTVQFGAIDLSPFVVRRVTFSDVAKQDQGQR